MYLCGLKKNENTTLSATQPVTIVIPLYRLNLSRMEEVSLRQCFKVMAGRDIAIVHPRSLEIEPLCRIAGSDRFRSEAFDDRWFDGREAYNRLMLSPELYGRFAESEFMAVVQSDVYLFSDRLDEWTDAGYDYVGAPWLPALTDVQGWNVFRRATYALRRLYGRVVPGFHPINLKYRVGNGGFSLRRTATFHQIARAHAHEINTILESARGSAGFEDVVWSVTLAGRYPDRIHVTPWREALAFSVESHPALAMRILDGQLPMGTHAYWRARNRRQWRQWVDFESIVSQSGD